MHKRMCHPIGYGISCLLPYPCQDSNAFDKFVFFEVILDTAILNYQEINTKKVNCPSKQNIHVIVKNPK